MQSRRKRFGILTYVRRYGLLRIVVDGLCQRYFKVSGGRSFPLVCMWAQSITPPLIPKEKHVLSKNKGREREKLSKILKEKSGRKKKMTEEKEEIRVKSHRAAFRDDENWEREVVERREKKCRK